MNVKDLFDKQGIIFRIFDGPDKKDLWMRTPRIDDFQSSKEITQLPVLFLVEHGEQKHRFHVYLDGITRMDNDPDSVIFRGTSIDPVSAESVIVQGQYNFVERKGMMEIRERLA